MSNLHVKSEQIAVQLFNSYFDLHGESSHVRSQNLFYTMEALCGPGTYFFVMLYSTLKFKGPNTIRSFYGLSFELLLNILPGYYLESQIIILIKKLELK